MIKIKSRFPGFYPYLLGLLFLSIIGVQLKAQEKTLNSDALKKAEEIINLARKATKGKNSSLKVTGLSAVFSSTSQHVFIKDNKEPDTVETSGEIKFDVSIADKVKFSLVEEFPDNTSFYNFVLNGDNFDSDSYIIFKGMRSNVVEKLTDEQKKQKVLEVKKRNFVWMFPLILESPSNASVEFKYIGKAEANGEKADVLETIMPDESRLRLFFDEKSHLLKMFINTGKTRLGAEYEEKRFFSDYKEKDGFLIANKMIIETIFLNKWGKAKDISQMTLKSIKFNPSFNPSYFVVKN